MISSEEIAFNPMPPTMTGDGWNPHDTRVYRLLSPQNTGQIGQNHNANQSFYPLAAIIYLYWVGATLV